MNNTLIELTKDHILKLKMQRHLLEADLKEVNKKLADAEQLLLLATIRSL